MAITFFGGEPLLNFPVVKYGMEYCKELYDRTGTSFGLYILTNGTVLTDEMYDFFVAAKKWKGICFHLQVSMDGCKESHDSNRLFVSGTGSFDSVVENVKKFRKIFPHLIVRKTVTPENISMLSKDFEALLYSGGVITNLTPIVEGDWSKKNIDIYEQELEKCIQLFIRHPENKKMFFNMLHGTLQRMGDKAFNSYHGCRAGHQLVGVTIDGDIYPCHRFVSYKNEFDYKIGNIRNGIDYEGENYGKLKEMQSGADRECERCKVYTCNRCYATNLHLNQASYKRPSNGYCAMNLQITNFLKKRLWELLMEKKVELEEGEIVTNTNTKVTAMNIGDGTEIQGDLQDVMARCLIKLVKENSIIKSKLTNIENHLGIKCIEPSDKNNIKR